MTTKHSPGPWIACKPEDALHAVRRPSDHNHLGMIICDVGYGETVEVNVANARLISAAPDLLAALEKASEQLQENFSMMQCDENGVGPDCTKYLQVLYDSKAAIAKATGAA